MRRLTFLKTFLRGTKDRVTEESFRIKGIEDANERIGSSIKDLERRQKTWATQLQERIQENTS